jgi:hypothetical protein
LVVDNRPYLRYTCKYDVQAALYSLYTLPYCLGTHEQNDAFLNPIPTC